MVQVHVGLLPKSKLVKVLILSQLSKLFLLVEMAGISIHSVSVLLTSSLGHARASTARPSLLVSIEPLFVPTVYYADITKPPTSWAAVFLNLVDFVRENWNPLVEPLCDYFKVLNKDHSPT